MEAHGGRIRAESEGPGQGTRFVSTLPTAEQAGGGPAVARLSPEREGREPEERLRVLAVDDAPQALRYIRDTLPGRATSRWSPASRSRRTASWSGNGLTWPCWTCCYPTPTA